MSLSDSIQYFCRANTRAARSCTTQVCVNPEPATSPLHSYPFQDPFGDHVKRIMQLIHDFMQLPRDFNLRKYGTQEYEADVVILNEQGKMKQRGSN